MHNAYGSQKVLKQYLGLRSFRFFRIPEIVWHHGWSPNIWNFDIDLIVDESGQTSELSHLTYFVGRPDQEIALRQAGLKNVWAIGLPFAYAMLVDSEDVDRIPNSVLVVPALHGSFSKEDVVHMDNEYLGFLEESLESFSYVRVMMNCDDIRLGRDDEWERRGFKVVLGGCEADDESLTRIVNIFRTYEVMTTNDFGSAIAYAASAGCRISVCGPRNPVDLTSKVWSWPFYQNRVDLGLTANSWFAKTEQYLEDKELMRLPTEARAAEDWGKEEIGFNAVRSPDELNSLIRSAYYRHTSSLDRIGLSPIRKRVKKLQSQFAVASIREHPGSTVHPVRLLQNMSTLMKKSEKPPRILRFVDSQGIVWFRPGTTDVDSLHNHFVSRDLDDIDLGHPKRILDIGCYTGYSMFFWTQRFPDASIVGIEPDPENFDLCAKNHDDNLQVRLLNKALWSEETNVSLIRGPDGAWSNKVIPLTDGFPKSEGITLHSVLQEIGWDSADIIKMDIEGAEYDVLGSVASNISRLCSLLIVKFHHKLARARELATLIDEIVTETQAVVREIGEFTVFDFRG